MLGVAIHALMQKNIDLKIEMSSAEEAKTLIKNIPDAYTRAVFTYKPGEYKQSINPTGSKYIGKQRQNFKKR